jgi:hypothetical protein
MAKGSLLERYNRSFTYRQPARQHSAPQQCPLVRAQVAWGRPGFEGSVLPLQGDVAATIAHEGGHFRWPYLGHDNKGPRFDTPAKMCNPQWRYSYEDYLKENPKCGCQ